MKIKFKNILFVLLFVTLIASVSGCSKETGPEADLSGKDLIAYNLMLEVCSVAKDPYTVQVISGTAVDVDGLGNMGVFVVDVGGVNYNIMVSYEDGEAVCENMLPEAVEYGKDELSSTCCFDIEAVNAALNAKWGSD